MSTTGALVGTAVLALILGWCVRVLWLDAQAEEDTEAAEWRDYEMAVARTRHPSALPAVGPMVLDRRQGYWRCRACGRAGFVGESDLDSAALLHIAQHAEVTR